MKRRGNKIAKKAGNGGGDLSNGSYLRLLGDRVRTMRSRRAMSRKVLAKHSAVSERYLAELEAGKGNCSIVLLRRIAKAMGIPVTELIDERPERDVEHLLFHQLLERLSFHARSARRRQTLGVRRQSENNAFPYLLTSDA